MKTDATFIDAPVYEGRGVVYVRNATGWQWRGRSYPCMSQSNALAIRTNRMATSGISYKMDLTTAQQNDWIAYAAGTPIVTTRGGPKTLEGHLMYQLVHMLRSAAGLSGGILAPASAGLGVLTPPNMYIGTGGIAVIIDTSDPWVHQNGACMVINAELVQMAWRSRKKRGGRQVGYILGSSATPPTAIQYFPSPWPITEEQTIYAEARIVDATNRPTGDPKTRLFHHYYYEPITCAGATPAGFQVDSLVTPPGNVFKHAGTCYTWPSILVAVWPPLPTVDISADPTYATCAACATPPGPCQFASTHLSVIVSGCSLAGSNGTYTGHQTAAYSGAWVLDTSPGTAISPTLMCSGVGVALNVKRTPLATCFNAVWNTDTNGAPTSTSGGCTGCTITATWTP